MQHLCYVLSACCLLLPQLGCSFVVVPPSTAPASISLNQNEQLLPRQQSSSLLLRQPSSLHIPSTATVHSSSSTAVSLAAQDVIEAGVSFDTFAPQFLWLLLIGAPKSDVTKRVMGSIAPIAVLALVHLAIVIVAALQEGAVSQILIFTEVFDPSLSQLAGMQKLFAFPNFVAEEWPHVLVWDLFVGRAIWMDGERRGVDTRLALSFCNFIGPPGLLIHVAACLLNGKGLPDMGYQDSEEK